MKSKALIFLLVLFSGCTTLNGMEQNSSGGSIQAYDADYKQTFDLALHACKVVDFEVESQDYEKKYIVAKNGISPMSWGERIGIYFKDLPETKTEVRIVSKAKMKTNVFAPKWASELHSEMQNRLYQLQENGIVKK